MKYCCSYILVVCLLMVESCASTAKPTNNIIQIPPEYHVSKIEVTVKDKANFPAAKIDNLLKEYLSRIGYAVVSRSTDLERIRTEHKIQGTPDVAKTRDKDMPGNIAPVDAIFVMEATDLDVIRDHGYTSVSDVTVVGRLIDVKTGHIIWVKNATWNPKNPIIGLIFLPFSIAASIFTNEYGQADPIMTTVAEVMGCFPPRR